MMCENHIRNTLFLFLLLCNVFVLKAQEQEPRVDSSVIVTNAFWDNWFGEVGTDLILLFPVHHDVKDVFPNGKSLGLSLAVGKWFSPEFGGKVKASWNNGLIRETHNIWYHPYGVKGGSHDYGGFLIFSGELLFNLHNFFGEYQPDRRWNLSLVPRFGGWFNVHEFKPGPILGVGLSNTYRLSNKWRLYADVNLNFISSINDIESDKGHGGNVYGEINVGVEMDLSKNNAFHRVSDDAKLYDKGTVVNPFWDNWFAQAGLGMCLQIPYGKNIAHVFPNGSTYGINLGLGKWFTSDIGVRGGMNWQNSIVVNHHAYYLSPMDDPQGGLDKRGFFSLYADIFFNLHHIIEGYSGNRKWNAIVYPRMGLAANFSSRYAECPIIGLGTEQTYVISDRMKLFADLVYQAVTSGFHDKKFKSADYGISHNGWFDLNVGIQVELGKSGGKFKQAGHR